MDDDYPRQIAPYPNLRPLTTRELAEMLSVTTRTVQAYRDAGRIPFLRVTARKFLYVWEQVERALAKRHNT